MARAAIDWGVRDLAAQAEVGISTITRFEAGRPAHAATVKAIAAALEEAGVRFTDDGCVCPPAGATR